MCKLINFYLYIAKTSVMLLIGRTTSVIESSKFAYSKDISDTAITFNAVQLPRGLIQYFCALFLPLTIQFYINASILTTIYICVC